MFKRISVLALTLSVVMPASPCVAALQMITLKGSDGSAVLLKQFVVPARSSILGVEFESSTGGSVPQVALFRGPLTTLADATPLTFRSNVQESTSGFTSCLWGQPVSTGKTGGEYYVAVSLPANSGADPMVKMEIVEEPSGSFVASSVEGDLTQIGANLAFTLLTDGSGIASSKGSVSQPNEPAQERSMTSFTGTYPNPSNAVMTIQFGVAETSYVSLEIYNVAGRRVRTLLRGRLSAGNHHWTWDGTDVAGVQVAAGIYLAKLRVGDQVLTRKIILTR